MRIRVLTIMLLIAALLAACGGAAGEASPPEQTARQMMQADGLGDAEITGVVEGDPAVRGADELYCCAHPERRAALPARRVAVRRAVAGPAAHGRLLRVGPAGLPAVRRVEAFAPPRRVNRNACPELDGGVVEGDVCLPATAGWRASQQAGF